MEGVALVDEWLEGGKGLLARRNWCMGEMEVVGEREGEKYHE